MTSIFTSYTPGYIAANIPDIGSNSGKLFTWYLAKSNLYEWFSVLVFFLLFLNFGFAIKLQNSKKCNVYFFDWRSTFTLYWVSDAFSSRRGHRAEEKHGNYLAQNFLLSHVQSPDQLSSQLIVEKDSVTEFILGTYINGRQYKFYYVLRLRCVPCYDNDSQNTRSVS